MECKCSKVKIYLKQKLEMVGDRHVVEITSIIGNHYWPSFGDLDFALGYVKWSRCPLLCILGM